MSLRKRLNLIEDWFTGTLLVSGLGLLLAGVIARYFFNKPIFWADEVAAYLVIWGALLGTGVALREDKHIQVNFVYDLLSPRLRWLVSLFGNVLGFAFCLFFVYGGIILLQKYIQIGQVSLNAMIPLWIPYSVVPLTGLIFGKEFLFQVYGLLKKGPGVWIEEQERREKDVDCTAV